ncbi:exocyst complex component Sec10-like protein [Tirmania nivea]|nr:exocyst complex component Sec10-like protein [Tirmania nivea]
MHMQAYIIRSTYAAPVARQTKRCPAAPQLPATKTNNPPPTHTSACQSSAMVSSEQPDGARSIFPKVASFNLATFSSKDFIVRDFIEGLSTTSLAAHRRSGIQTAAFDPKPYIRTFEAALERLKELDQDLSERESDLKEGARRAEIEHSRTIERLGSKFNQTLQEFQRLDASIADGGGTAVRIGGELEQLDKQRQRAADAMFLIRCYSDFCHGDASRLEALRKTGRIEDSIKCAVVARQLTMIARRSEGSSQSRDLIEKFSETLEKDLLKQFDRASRNKRLEDMKGCAKVLYDFNGGASVTQIFVNQRDFFINKENLVTGEILTEGDIWEKLPDPDVDPPGVEPSLQKLIREVKYVLESESEIIAKVFPQPELVLGKFLQRVFQQSIQQRLEMVLQTTEKLSTLAYLRTLQAARVCIGQLVDELKAHGLTEHPSPLSSTTTIVIDQNLEELFLPYLAGSSYIDREKVSLDQLYAGVLLKFNLFHSRRKKMQNMTYFDRMKISATKVSTEARAQAALEKANSADHPTTGGAWSRVLGVRRTDTTGSEDGGAAPTTPGGTGATDKLGGLLYATEADGALSIDTAKRMLRWLAEAVGRSLELSPSSDTPKDVLTLLTLLIDHMRKAYLETALDAALEAAEAATSKSEPDLSYFGEIKPATVIMTLMFGFINTALIPLASASLTVRREMMILNNASVGVLEGKIDRVVQKTLDVVLGWVSGLLAKQKKSDYRPKDDDVSLTTLQTQTAAAIVAFLAKVHTVAVTALSGQNLSAFLAELAASLLSLVLEHMKRFTVNAAGGIMLTKDVSAYHAAVKSWEIREAREGWEFAQEVANLFVVGQGALRERLADKVGVLSRVRPAALKVWLCRREDYVGAGIEKLLSE